MKVRFLGHSCVEIVGRTHVLIDPDFVREPEPGVEFICITHAHRDHIARVAEVPTGLVVASPDVCAIAMQLGVAAERLLPVTPGFKAANIEVLPGFSAVGGFLYTFFSLLFRRRRPDPGGTPLSFLVHDDLSLLHIGDAHDVRLPVHPDILCLPWRRAPYQPEKYKARLIQLARRIAAPYVLPVHYDLPTTAADPGELRQRLAATLLDGEGWHDF